MSMSDANSNFRHKIYLVQFDLSNCGVRSEPAKVLLGALTTALIAFFCVQINSVNFYSILL
jgi:uncharacterized membrane protein